MPRDHTNNKSLAGTRQRRGFDPDATELDILDLELELNLFRALSPTQALGAGLMVYGEGRDMAERRSTPSSFFATNPAANVSRAGWARRKWFR